MATNPTARTRGFHWCLVSSRWPRAHLDAHAGRTTPSTNPTSASQNRRAPRGTQRHGAARRRGRKGRWSTQLSPLAVGQRHKLPTTNGPEMSFGLVWGTRDRLPGGAALPHAEAMGRRDPVSGPSRLWPQRRHGRAACSLPSTHRGYERGACWSRPAPGGRRQGVRNSSPPPPRETPVGSPSTAACSGAPA